MLLELEITLSCLVLWYCVNIHLPPQFSISPPIQSVECLQKKYVIISLDICESPLGEVQREPAFADELRQGDVALDSPVYGAFALNAGVL